MKYDFSMSVFVCHYLRLEEDMPTVALNIMNRDLQSNLQLAKLLYTFQMKEVGFTYSTLIRSSKQSIKTINSFDIHTFLANFVFFWFIRRLSLILLALCLFLNTEMFLIFDSYM